MLAYVSIAIGICNIGVGLVFVSIWADLRYQIKYSLKLREDFRATLRRLAVSTGIFVIPLVEYFLYGVLPGG